MLSPCLIGKAEHGKRRFLGGQSAFFGLVIGGISTASNKPPSASSMVVRNSPAKGQTSAGLLPSARRPRGRASVGGSLAGVVLDAEVLARD